MTNRSDQTLIDEENATDEGAQGLAAADLAGQVMRLLQQALDASEMDQKALADKLGVTQGRVSQVINGDGNMKIAAVGRYLRALGYETHLVASPLISGLPALPLESRHPPATSSQSTVTEQRYVARLPKRRRVEAKNA
ncbi:helix-turn-helix domain-containing protein [Mycolicibacterium chubuense]|uniref:Helix-turn-helix protein n=1 Tax=Mycolicibacterium chubuense TaxID=1800 RepID=A0A0J6VV46_MYCCU|nr:helix-turn-helix transcriptional regulator [Mycolicibacterium chubuense]KMO73363.1 helix-turn-helix protein [Mycolicibacterium chubuense]SPX98897.1 Fis family transcriptional regulator [Mycolicibacterium chubuense]